MYEAKYRRYLNHGSARFAEKKEILNISSEAFTKINQTGIPLIYHNKSLYVDNSDNHTMVIGPTGCKKSRVTVFSTVASIIEGKESAVINDPKGEVYVRTAARAREKGAKVIVLNFRDPATSDCWNPLSQAKVLMKRGKRDEALQCINDFVEAVMAPALENTKDAYWENSAKTLLSAIAQMLADSLTQAQFNIKTIIPFCYMDCKNMLKSVAEQMDPYAPATFGLKSVVDLEAERTISCIYSVLLTTLSPFVKNEQLTNMLSGETFDLETLGKEQTLVYIIYPDEKTSLNFLVNMFLTQCYEVLVDTAKRYESISLPVRVNFILDEFSNLTRVASFDNRISEARSKNIRYFLYIQSYEQLKNKYGGCAETILSNCNNWICFSSKEMSFLEKISQICGKEIDYNGREQLLLSPFEMQHLKKRDEGSEVVVIKQGQYPFVTELPDFDYLPISKRYKKSKLLRTSREREIETVTPQAWIRKVENGILKFPYPKKCA